MKPADININIRSWNRFGTDGLKVHPEVMGKRHKFQFNSAEIEIQLPSIDDADRDKKYDEIAEVGTRWARDNRPIDYRILKVDVIVRLGRSIALSPEVLEVNANAFDLIPENQQKTLENISEEQGELAEKAVEYWLSVLRWITDDYRIDRPYIASSKGDWGVRLFDDNSQKKIWVQSSTVRVPGHHLVTIDDWTKAGNQLQKQRKAPIYMSLKHDAEKFLAIGDYRRSLIDLAISCETFLRNIVLDTLPSALDTEIWKFIEEGNINQFASRFIPSVLTADAATVYKKRFKPELASLFVKRNAIMHRGDSTDATAENCNRFLGMLNELLKFVPSSLDSKNSTSLSLDDLPAT